MFLMGVTYKVSKNLKMAWSVFGIIYLMGIFGILNNDYIFSIFNIEQKGGVIAPLSLIILGLGVMLSYIIFGKNERLLILAILLVVGIHLVPIGNRLAFITAGLVCLNTFLGFYFKQADVSTFIFSDSLIKFGLGSVLLLVI